jgi:outer membrane receptor protein involved in Fe transport
MVRGVAGGTAMQGQWSFGGGVERTVTDGFTGTAPATGEQVSNDDWRAATAAGNVTWRKSPVTFARSDVRWLDNERGNPGPYGSNPIGIYAGVDRGARGFDTQKQLGLQCQTPWGHLLEGRVQQRFEATWSDLDNRYDPNTRLADPLDDSFFETHRFTARAQTDLIATPTTGISFGVEGLGERARNTYIVDAASQQVPIKRHIVGVFGEVRQNLGPRASVTAGLRVDSIHRDALPGDPNPFGPRPPFSEDSDTSTNPRVAATVVVWQDAEGRARTIVHGSAGTGIRPPDAFEIAFTDNPGLLPEKSKSFDFGVSQKIVDRLTVDATGFLNHYDDLIVAVGGTFTDLSRFRTDNIANARARGLEFGVSWRGPAGVIARGAYTFLDTEVLAVDTTTTAPPPFKVGDPLLRRPRNQGSLDLAWSRDRLSAFAEARARDRVLDVEPTFGTFGGLFEAPGYFVVDTGAGWHVLPSVEVFARGLNLFNRSYEEVYGYQAPGRLGVVGVRVAFRP